MSDYLDSIKDGQLPILNLQKVLDSNDVPEFLKAITRSILSNKAGHYSFGEWVRSASWIDIDCLDSLCDIISEQKKSPAVPSERIEHLMGGMAVLATKLFAIGEGLSSLTMDEEGIVLRIRLIQSFITAEGLVRAGLPVKVYYENMSLDEEVRLEDEDRIIIEMFPELRPDVDFPDLG